jgi:hypothetical protein
VLQLWLICASPTQALPPQLGAGVVQVRVPAWVPPPQATEQAPQLQALQPPSTAVQAPTHSPLLQTQPLVEQVAVMHEPPSLAGPWAHALAVQLSTVHGFWSSHTLPATSSVTPLQSSSSPLQASTLPFALVHAPRPWSPQLRVPAQVPPAAPQLVESCSCLARVLQPQIFLSALHCLLVLPSLPTASTHE